MAKQPRKGPEAGGDRDRKIGDIVARAVGLGAHVLTENIRQAQSAADRYRAGHYEWDDVDQDVGKLGDRMAEAAGRMTGYWFDMTRAMVRAPVRVLSRAADGGGPRSIRSGCKVISSKPVKAELDFRAEPRPSARLVAHELQPHPASGAPPLKPDVVRSDEGDVIMAFIQVPDDQPAGLYSGTVVDVEPQIPLLVGTLSVLVEN